MKIRMIFKSGEQRDLELDESVQRAGVILMPDGPDGGLRTFRYRSYHHGDERVIFEEVDNYILTLSPF